MGWHTGNLGVVGSGHLRSRLGGLVYTGLGPVGRRPEIASSVLVITFTYARCTLSVGRERRVNAGRGSRTARSIDVLQPCAQAEPATRSTHLLPLLLRWSYRRLRARTLSYKSACANEAGSTRQTPIGAVRKGIGTKPLPSRAPLVTPTP